MVEYQNDTLKIGVRFPTNHQFTVNKQIQVMGNLKSSRRKLDPNRVQFAIQVEQKKLELAKEFVKERVTKDAEFARDVLKAIGDLLPEDIKKLAQETVLNEDVKKNQEAIKGYVSSKRDQLESAGLTPCIIDDGDATEHGYVLDKSKGIPDGCKPFIDDGGCSTVEVSNAELLKALKVSSERQTERLKAAGLLPDAGCCGNQCGCHSSDDVSLGDGFIAVQSDGGGQIIVHETEHPNYLKDGLPSEEDPTVKENDLENALKKHISNSGI